MMKQDSAPEALEELAVHRRITAAIGGLHATAVPREDWQARVMASVRATRPAAVKAPASDEQPADAERPRREAALDLAPGPSWRFWRSWRSWLPMGAMAAAAAGVLLLVVPRHTTEPPGPALAVELDATRVTIDRGSGSEDDGAYRRPAPAVGSRVHVAATSAAAHRALWIFRGRDELVLSCPGAGCTASDESLAAELTVPRMGEYLVMALWSSEPIPPPPASRDEALAAAARAGLTQRSYRFTVW